MKSNIISIALIVFVTVAFQNKETTYFEGKITYIINTIGKDGSELDKEPFKQDVYIKPPFYKFKLTGGSVSEVNFGEIIANSKDSSRYNVNHFRQTTQNLGMERNGEEYRLKSVNFIHANDSVLGYRCKKYEIYQKDHLSGAEMVKYVWIAENLKLKNLPLLAKIFGYQNTLLKDGSLPGILLKSENINLDHSITITQATEVKPMDLEEEIFNVPVTYTEVSY